MGALTRREMAVKAALDAVRARCDVAARRESDPVGIVHRYTSLEDRELVGLVAACIAFGNVTTIRAKLEDLLERLGPRPARAADRPRALEARLRGWKHRVFLGDDVRRLLCGARAVQREYGSLGARFAIELRRGTLREALAALCDAIRKKGGLGAASVRGKRDAGVAASGPIARRRGPSHLLSDVRGPSANKRLLLFLRWMARPADGVDLGLWDVDAARLLVPVDVHVHRLSYNLGLTRRRTTSWRTTEEITRALARFDPRDPVKYDFSLCHMGMLQRCPSRRDERRCSGCPVMPVCIHWKKRSTVVGDPCEGKREEGG